MGKSRRKAAAIKRAPKAPPAPVCTAFVICDSVIIADDTTATAVRIVDAIGLPADKKRKVGDMIGITGVVLFIALKKGEAQDGEHALDLICVDPDERRTLIGKLPFKAAGDATSGTNTKAALGVRWSREGLYWYELRLGNGALIARTPFKLIEGTVEQVKKRVQSDNEKAIASKTTE